MLTRTRARIVQDFSVSSGLRYRLPIYLRTVAAVMTIIFESIA